MGEIEDRLRAARYYARLDQDEFAVHLETSVATLNRIENGTRVVDPEKERYMLERAAAITGLPVSFFTADLGVLERPSTQRNSSGSPDVGRELRQLSKQLGELRKTHEREIERLQRGIAHDRGRLTRIEKNLVALAERVLE